MLKYLDTNVILCVSLLHGAIMSIILVLEKKKKQALFKLHINPIFKIDCHFVSDEIRLFRYCRQCPVYLH